MGGLKLGSMTFSSLFKKPETILYPVVVKTPPAGLKGSVVNDADTCILCGLCSRRCPTGAIEVIKTDHMWKIDRFRCIQCGSCVRECPKSCLTMDPHYTAPATSKSIDVLEIPETPKDKESKEAQTES